MHTNIPTYILTLMYRALLQSDQYGLVTTVGIQVLTKNTLHTAWMEATEKLQMLQQRHRNIRQ